MNALASSSVRIYRNTSQYRKYCAFSAAMLISVWSGVRRGGAGAAARLVPERSDRRHRRRHRVDRCGRAHPVLRVDPLDDRSLFGAAERSAAANRKPDRILSALNIHTSGSLYSIPLFADRFRTIRYINAECSAQHTPSRVSTCAILHLCLYLIGTEHRNKNPL